MQNTSYLQTQTVRQALEFTLAKRGFGLKEGHKKTARMLLKQMNSTSSVSGRHDKLRRLLKNGATIADMIKATGSSRRTIFRYLNHFEDAGFDIAIIDGQYRMK